MLKGVTRRIVEIRRPSSDYFERAVLYLRTDRPFPKRSEAVKEAENYLDSMEEPKNFMRRQRDLRPVVAVLTVSLAVSLLAIVVLLVLFTKI